MKQDLYKLNLKKSYNIMVALDFELAAIKFIEQYALGL